MRITFRLLALLALVVSYAPLGSVRYAYSQIGVLDLTTRTPTIATINESGGLLQFREQKRGKWSVAKLAKFPSLRLSPPTEGVIAPRRLSAFTIKKIPHLIFQDKKTGLLNVAFRKLDKWYKAALDRKHSARDYFAATLCGSEICVVYSDRLGNSLYLARGKEKRWKNTVITYSTEDIGAMSALSSNSGKIDLAFLNQTQRKVQVAVQEGEDRWRVETVSYLGRAAGLYPSIQRRSDGTLFVAYIGYPSGRERSDGDLYLSVRAPDGSWSSSCVADDFVGGEVSLKLLPDGRPVLAYNYRAPTSEGGSVERLELAELLSSGVFQKTEIEPTGIFSAPRQLALQSDSSGALRLVFAFSRTGRTPFNLDLVTLRRVGDQLLPVAEAEYPIR